MVNLNTVSIDYRLCKTGKDLDNHLRWSMSFVDPVSKLCATSSFDDEINCLRKLWQPLIILEYLKNKKKSYTLCNQSQQFSRKGKGREKVREYRWKMVMCCCYFAGTQDINPVIISACVFVKGEATFSLFTNWNWNFHIEFWTVRTYPAGDGAHQLVYKKCPIIGSPTPWYDVGELFSCYPPGVISSWPGTMVDDQFSLLW